MFHKNSLEKMRSHLSTAVDKCVIESSWPNYDTFIDDLQLFSAEVMKHKRNWLTTRNIHSIFINEVTDKLKKKFDKKVSGVLKELLSSDEKKVLNESIISFIDSIPRKYSIYFPLPNFVFLGHEIIELSPGFSIRFYTDENKIPGGVWKGGLTEGVAGLLANYREEQKHIRLEKNYLCIEEVGYIDGSSDDLAFANAFSKLKQFLKFGLYNRIFEIRRKMGLLRGGSQFYQDALIFDHATNSISSPILLPLNVSKHLENIAVSERLIDLSRRKQIEILELIIDQLIESAKLIQSFSNEWTTPIKSALEWAFEADLSDNETVSFLQISIGIESILGGDTEEEGLTRLLSDRCAYLIGANTQERKKIKEDFKEFYRLRSKLVHGRAMKLNTEEKKHLTWGKSILHLIILKELKNTKLD